MYYHLTDHIYITQFREEIILLDTKRDKYSIFFKEVSEFLKGLISENIHPAEGTQRTFLTSPIPPSSQDTLYIQKFLDDGIMETKNFPYPYYIDEKLTSEGVSNVDWRLPLENKKISLNIKVLNAFIMLIRVNFFIKFKGLYETIQLVKKSRYLDKKYIIPQEEELRDLANIVNKACLLYPTRTKCLEWAITLTLLALKRGWKCNLEIGVQNYPFMAHAWVECDGKVVMDSQEIRQGLGIILNEPFRRLNK